MSTYLLKIYKIYIYAMYIGVTNHYNGYRDEYHIFFEITRVPAYRFPTTKKNIKLENNTN